MLDLSALSAEYLLFAVCQPGSYAPKPRRMGSPAGLGDRMRAAAFAELQAEHAFTWAAETFDDVPASLRQAWARQVAEERLHYNLIVDRMRELDLALDERPVSSAMWRSLVACEGGREFCVKITSAEERGRQAALHLAAFLGTRDPQTAAVFQRIADDEVAHVALVQRYFG